MDTEMRAVGGGGGGETDRQGWLDNHSNKATNMMTPFSEPPNGWGTWSEKGFLDLSQRSGGSALDPAQGLRADRY